MNKLEIRFLQQYKTASKLLCGDVPLDSEMIAMPCECDAIEEKPHLCVVSTDPLAVKAHLDLYAPKGTPWPDGIEKPAQKTGKKQGRCNEPIQ